jgi:hypothetical protein
VVFSWHLANTSSFMASIRAYTEPISCPFLRACIFLLRPTRCITVYDNASSFTPTSPAIWVASHLCTSKHHNSDIRYRAHTYLHHTITTIQVLLTLLPFFWAGWLSSIPFVRYKRCWCIIRSCRNLQVLFTLLSK